MEQLLLEKLQTLTPLPSNDLITLTLARSLLTNPNSSPSTLDSATKTLIQTLDSRRQDSSFARHVIKVIGDAAYVHRSLVPLAIQVVRPFLNGDDGVAADALAVLDSLGEYDLLDEELVISLASSPIVSVRLRIVEILGSKLDVLRPELMMRVLSGLSTDIYPSVRNSAVRALVGLSKRDGLNLKCVYDRGVELLRDEDELVRLAAVKLVSECARLFAVDEAGSARELINVIFVQLCWMARDMNLKVRLEAFIALGGVRLVSEGVLLQSLSKKILGSKSEGSSLTECIVKESKCPMSCAAGAFVHGIEDEFHEVRTAACKSLGTLSRFSIQFAENALNLLMDMLNDDVLAVRLQTLQNLFHMATRGRLTIQEKHMQMFLGSLADISAVIRHAAREVLRLMKLPKLEMFIAAVDGLIENLVMHPEEEEDIFSALFFIGKNHGNFAAKRVKGFEVEIAPFCKGELGLDCPQAAALLVLALSWSCSGQQLKFDVPPTVFSYAVPLFGKISHALKHVMRPEFLLVHLGNLSGMPFPARTLNFKDAELLSCVAEEGMSNNTKCTGPSRSSSWPIHNETSEISFQRDLFDPSETSTSLELSRQKESSLDEYSIQSVKLLFKAATEIWLLIQSQRTHKAQRMLRSCKEELEMIGWNADGHIAALLAFASYHVEVIQLFAEIWEQLKPRHVICMNTLDLLLQKLDSCLKRLRYSFSGFSREEECHILELTMLAYILRVCKVGTCSCLVLNKLEAAFSRLEYLTKEGPLKHSSFRKELRMACIEQTTSEVPRPFPVQKLLELFSLEQFPLAGGFKHIKAELLVTENNSENPLLYVSGLPVGITFQITLYNVSNKNTLWLQMAVGQSVQFVFLDPCKFEGSDTTRTCTVNLPFYETPKAPSFLLRACICMECKDEVVIDCKNSQGPKYDVTLLSEEIDVYLAQIRNR